MSSTPDCSGCWFDEVACMEAGHCFKNPKIIIGGTKKVEEFMERNIINYAPEGMEGADLVAYLAAKEDKFYFAVYVTKEDAKALSNMEKGVVKNQILKSLMRKQQKIDDAARMVTADMGFNYLM